MRLLFHCGCADRCCADPAVDSAPICVDVNGIGLTLLFLPVFLLGFLTATVDVCAWPLPLGWDDERLDVFALSSVWGWYVLKLHHDCFPWAPPLHSDVRRVGLPGIDCFVHPPNHGRVVLPDLFFYG
jgi:hypothetical protein